MNLLDKIKAMFSGEGGDKGKNAQQAVNEVKQAAQASNYNQASIKAFYALEEIGKQYASVDREPSTTVREYGKLLVDEGRTNSEELEPILINFEIAKYSPSEVTFEAYQVVENTLDQIHAKYKSGKMTSVEKKKSKSSKRRRPKKRSTGAGTRRRRNSE
jgi:hypothetical protein